MSNVIYEFANISRWRLQIMSPLLFIMNHIIYRIFAQLDLVVPNHYTLVEIIFGASHISPYIAINTHTSTLTS